MSPKNYLLYTPMLAEVASGSLEAQHISAPVRASRRKARAAERPVTQRHRRPVTLAMVALLRHLPLAA